jgi:hypothetical protein
MPNAANIPPTSIITREETSEGIVPLLVSGMMIGQGTSAGARPARPRPCSDGATTCFSRMASRRRVCLAWSSVLPRCRWRPEAHPRGRTHVCGAGGAREFPAHGRAEGHVRRYSLSENGPGAGGTRGSALGIEGFSGPAWPRGFAPALCIDASVLSLVSPVNATLSR